MPPIFKTHSESSPVIEYKYIPQLLKQELQMPVRILFVMLAFTFEIIVYGKLIQQISTDLNVSEQKLTQDLEKDQFCGKS